MPVWDKRKLKMNRQNSKKTEESQNDEYLALLETYKLEQKNIREKLASLEKKEMHTKTLSKKENDKSPVKSSMIRQSATSDKNQVPSVKQGRNQKHAGKTEHKIDTEPAGQIPNGMDYELMPDEKCAQLVLVPDEKDAKQVSDGKHAEQVVVWKVAEQIALEKGAEQVPDGKDAEQVPDGKDVEHDVPEEKPSIQTVSDSKTEEVVKPVVTDEEDQVDTSSVATEQMTADKPVEIVSNNSVKITV